MIYEIKDLPIMVSLSLYYKEFILVAKLNKRKKFRKIYLSKEGDIERKIR